jgi:hypothetical protein
MERVEQGGEVRSPQGASRNTIKEYQLGIEAAQAQHPLRQRGIFYIGLFDLVEAPQERRIGAECAPRCSSHSANNLRRPP